MKTSCDSCFGGWPESYVFPSENVMRKKFFEREKIEELPRCRGKIEMAKFADIEFHPIIPEYIKPEVMGCVVGGVASLALAALAFVSGQIGAGLALLGPFFAAILGCSFLIVISKR